VTDILKNELKEQADAAKRENSFLTNKINMFEQTFQTIQQEWDKEKEDMKRQINQLTHRDQHFQHEIRKKEHEYNKLKDKVNLLFTARTGPSAQKKTTITYESLENLTYEHDELFKSLITQLEREQRALQQEVAQCQQECRAAEHAMTDLELQVTRALKIEERDAEQRLTRVKQELTRVSEMKRDEQEQLLAQLAQYQTIIREQDKLLQLATSPQLTVHSAVLERQ
jgi:YD repeat-containing protein